MNAGSNGVTDQPVSLTGSGIDISSGSDGNTKAQVNELVGRAKEQAQEVVSQTKQKAGELADKAKGQIVTQLSAQKETATGTLGEVASAIRQVGDGASSDKAFIRDYAQAAADQVEKLSGYLQNRDIDQIVRDTEDFARHQPALFLGGAFLLGVMASRFLKSSSRASINAGSWNTTPGNGRTPNALVPVGGSMEEDEAFSTNPVITAHDYIPGGIAGSGSQSNSDFSGGSAMPASGTGFGTTPGME